MYIFDSRVNTRLDMSTRDSYLERCSKFRWVRRQKRICFMLRLAQSLAYPGSVESTTVPYAFRGSKTQRSHPWLLTFLPEELGLIQRTVASPDHGFCRYNMLPETATAEESSELHLRHACFARTSEWKVPITVSCRWLPLTVLPIVFTHLLW